MAGSSRLGKGELWSGDLILMGWRALENLEKLGDFIGESCSLAVFSESLARRGPDGFFVGEEEGLSPDVSAETLVRRGGAGAGLRMEDCGERLWGGEEDTLNLDVVDGEIAVLDSEVATLDCEVDVLDGEVAGLDGEDVAATL